MPPALRPFCTSSIMSPLSAESAPSSNKAPSSKISTLPKRTPWSAPLCARSTTHPAMISKNGRPRRPHPSQRAKKLTTLSIKLPCVNPKMPRKSSDPATNSPKPPRSQASLLARLCSSSALGSGSIFISRLRVAAGSIGLPFASQSILTSSNLAFRSAINLHHSCQSSGISRGLAHAQRHDSPEKRYPFPASKCWLQRSPEQPAAYGKGQPQIRPICAPLPAPACLAGT